MITEITLVDQESGEEWGYRVIAVNKAGEGESSNTVRRCCEGVRHE